MPDLELVPEPTLDPQPEPLRIDLALDAMAARLGRLVGGLGDPDAAAFLGAGGGSGRERPAANGLLELPYGAAQPIDRLVRGLRLTDFDQELLLLALLPERDESTAAVLRGLHPAGQPWATLGLAAAMAEQGLLTGATSRIGLREQLADSAVFRHGLARLEGNGPRPECSLHPQSGLWSALIGSDEWPEGVRRDDRPTPDWGLDRWLALPAVRAAATAVGRTASVTVLATSPRPAALTGRLAALVRTSGAIPVVLRLERLDDDLVRQVLTQSLARHQVPIIWEPPGRETEIDLMLPELPVPLVISALQPGVSTWPRTVLRVPTTALEPLDRAAAVARAIPALAESGPVGPATIEPRDLVLATAEVEARLAYGGPQTVADVRRELVSVVDARMAASVPVGTLLVHPAARWTDLVLPPDQLLQLREAAHRFGARQQVLDDWGFAAPRNGSRGLRMLFVGPPGTGKTLGAEVIAGELGRDLLIVDLSRLVSKWIGETEKNLSAVFDAAESADAALFFDEADALFGRRTEIGDARDRYANLETAYLLFRLERFDGVAVLASNLRQNIDPAFTRRIEFIVGFDPPDQAARLRLWRLHVPETAPVDPAVSLPELAALYELPGALIRNAALAAAFLAAHDGQTSTVPPDSARITIAHFVHAIRREYTKVGQAFPGLPTGLQDHPPTGKGAPR